MDDPQRLYISCAMSGEPNFNKDLMNQRAEELREKGFDVINPAELDLADDYPRRWAGYLGRDLDIITRENSESESGMDIDAIALITESPWEESAGVLCELLAAAKYGIPILDSKTLEPMQFGYDVWAIPAGADGESAQERMSPERLTMGGDD